MSDESKNDRAKILDALELVAESIPVPMAWTNKDTVVLGVNERGLKTIGTSREAYVGKSVFEIYPHDMALIIKKHDEEVIRTGKIMQQEEAVTNITTGETMYFMAVKSPLRDQTGEIFGIVVTALDITAQKRAEHQLREAKDLAERMTQAKSNFLATMSHELRTPLNGILGMAQVLMNKNPSAEQHEYIEAIEQSGKNLLILINDVLDFSKLEAGQVEIHSEQFSPKLLIKEITNVMQHVIQGKPVELKTEFDSNIPDYVLGDEVRLRQILMNLVGNAIKFTLQGHVKITLNLVSLVDDIAKIEFSIKDSGIGIPTDKLSTIFDRFTQVESEYSRRFEGSGLGLAIVKNLVEMMGGTISVDSEFGKGSTFTCILPFVKVEQDPAKSSTNIANAAKQLQSFDKTTQFNHYILVVEDNAINQTVMRAMLTNLGCKVDVASNGKEALKQYEEHEYDLIFMDIGLPDMDGLQVTKALLDVKKKLKRKNIPIIALTAHVMEDDRKNCLKVGMTDMLTKPIVHAQLVELLRRLIKPSK